MSGISADQWKHAHLHNKELLIMDFKYQVYTNAHTNVFEKYDHINMNSWQ